MDLILSPLAETDLEAIYVYTVETHGLAQLDVYAGILEAAMEAVADDPMVLGSKARDDLSLGCRFYRAGHHYLAYRVREGRVEVGRILHESMNFQLHVDEEAFGGG